MDKGVVVRRGWGIWVVASGRLVLILVSHYVRLEGGDFLPIMCLQLQKKQQDD